MISCDYPVKYCVRNILAKIESIHKYTHNVIHHGLPAIAFNFLLIIKFKETKQNWKEIRLTFHFWIAKSARLSTVGVSVRFVFCTETGISCFRADFCYIRVISASSDSTWRRRMRLDRLKSSLQRMSLEANSSNNFLFYRPTRKRHSIWRKKRRIKLQKKNEVKSLKIISSEKYRRKQIQ